MAPILSLPPAVNGFIGSHLSFHHQTTTGDNDDNNTQPTRTLPQAISKVLSARQVVTTTVVADSGDSTSGGTTLSGGAIAGIVLGTIAGTLLLLWLIRSCLNLGSPGLWGSTFEPEHEKTPAASYDYPPSRHHHHQHHHHRRRSHSPRRASFVSVTTTTAAPRPVVVEPQGGRSPRAPQPAYYPRKGEAADARELRRLSDSRRHRGY
ncbi:hypothetical protein F5X96DRAFT_625132 [Biscogniauxia mediterranea]|nr:hypothetical protein F5X96DRAFT_625132 [Biscogniauxia mediterranea]